MTRWDIFREMDTMSREMDSLLGTLGFGRTIEPGLLSPVSLRGYPRFDVREEGDHFTVTAVITSYSIHYTKLYE